MTSKRRHRALLDSNVLASMTLTDLLVQLAVDDLFHAKWTAEIHREWIAAVLKFRPRLDPQALERRRVQMDTKAHDALVTGYENLIDELTLPDANDCHVLAAAIHSRCDLIVTGNLKDFPNDILRRFGIESQHPDIFLFNLLERYPLEFCAAVRKVRHRAQHPPYSVEEFLVNLRRAGLHATASEIKQFSHLLN